MTIHYTMIKKIVLLALIATAYNVDAQYISGVTSPDSSAALITDESDLSVKYANTITAEDMKRHLTVIGPMVC